jgi:hypothetical protein
MLIAKVALIGLTAFPGAPGRVDCMCNSYVTKDESVAERVKVDRKHAKALFSGEVIRVVEKKTEDGHTLEAHFRVIDSWKHVRTSSVVVVTHYPAPGGCGYPFQAGQSYLVYVEHKQDGELWTSICSRTGPLAQAEADMEILGRGKMKIKSN